MSDPRKVFVVFGRNIAAKNAIFDLLRSLDLRPLEWEEVVRATDSSSPYIYEILERGFDLAQAILVIFTPDESVVLHPQLRRSDADGLSRHQSRANVLFEAGMAFMRDRKRTVLVEFGPASQASDLHGIHTIRAFPTSGAELRKQIADRLRVAGCAIVTDGEDWLRAGDFASAFLKLEPQSQTEGILSSKSPIKFERTHDIDVSAIVSGTGRVEKANFMVLNIENNTNGL